MENILEIQHLKKAYNKHEVLKDVNMHVPKGAIYGLVGKNGVGKTTIMRILMGLSFPSGGNFALFKIKNTDKNIGEARKRMAAIIENPNLFYSLAAKENLEFICKLTGGDAVSINELLKKLQLPTSYQKVQHFSLGMKQKLGIAMSLVTCPDVFILDEPTNGLDPEGILNVRELILKLNKEYGITFLIASHHLDDLAKIATHYGFLGNGILLEEISAQDLQKKLKAKTILTVSNLNVATIYLKKKKKSFEIIDTNKIVVYGALNNLKTIKDLAKLKCEVINISNDGETLESYFLNLGGSHE